MRPFHINQIHTWMSSNFHNNVHIFFSISWYVNCLYNFENLRPPQHTKTSSGYKSLISPQYHQLIKNDLNRFLRFSRIGSKNNECFAESVFICIDQHHISKSLVEFVVELMIK